MPSRAPKFFASMIPFYAPPVESALWGRAGYTLAYSAQPEVQSSDGSRFRPYVFRIKNRRNEAIAHGRLVLADLSPLSSSKHLLAEHANSYEISALLRVLASCQGGISKVFSLGRVLDIEYFELARSARGQGLGAALGESLLRMFCSRFGAVLAVLRPWPLQYLARSRKLDDTPAFLKARRKLSRCYQKSWAMRPLGRSGWLGMTPQHGVRLEASARSWSLSSEKS